MFLRILGDSILRQKRKKAIALTAVGLGTAVAAALGDIALDIGDKVSAELKSFGANLVLVPRGGASPVVVGGEDVSSLRVPSYLDAAELPKVKDNCWKNNILGFAPALDLPARAAGRTVRVRGTWFDRSWEPAGRGGSAAPPRDASTLTGARSLNPFWSVEGEWPDDLTASSREAAAGQALVGRALASALGARPGSRLEVDIGGRAVSLTVSGILTTGDREDEEGIFVPIETVWRLPGYAGRISSVAVRALTTPESAVYERLALDPRSLPPAEFEKWICTPFVSSIAYELEKA